MRRPDPALTCLGELTISSPRTQIRPIGHTSVSRDTVMIAESSIVANGDKANVPCTDTSENPNPQIYFRRCRKADATAVTSQWRHLIENFSFSSREFYRRVEIGRAHV